MLVDMHMHPCLRTAMHAHGYMSTRMDMSMHMYIRTGLCACSHTHRPMLMNMRILMDSDARTCHMYMNVYMCHGHAHTSTGGVALLRTGRMREGVSRPV